MIINNNPIKSAKGTCIYQQ